MEVQNEEDFIKGVESLIKPMEVSNLLVFQKLKTLLPLFAFKRMLGRASKKNPYIGFVIEPYSLFLFFKLKDIEAARKLLPDRYELVRAKVFEDDEPEYLLGIGNLSTRASTFWGARLECYVVARDTTSGLLSWIFIDILSNTLIALPSKGIENPNSRNAIFTTSSKGEVFLDIEENKTGRRLALRGSVRNGKTRSLDQPLWVMGNTSIGHRKSFADGEDVPFAVIFDPAEVSEGMDIPPGDISISVNTLFPDLAEQELYRVVCFPFAQHYIADSPGCRTIVKDPADLVEKYNRLATVEEHKTFSAKTIVTQLGIGIAASALIVIALAVIF